MNMVGFKVDLLEEIFFYISPATMQKVPFQANPIQPETKG
jgi:hypothetical protein